MPQIEESYGRGREQNRSQRHAHLRMREAMQNSQAYREISRRYRRIKHRQPSGFAHAIPNRLRRVFFRPTAVNPGVRKHYRGQHDSRFLGEQPTGKQQCGYRHP